MSEWVLGPDVLARARFAVSVVAETTTSLGMLRNADAPVWHRGWFARHSPVFHETLRREPLWAARGDYPVVVGLAVDHRQLLVTTLTEAQPDIRESSPQPSVWPLITAIATTIFFVGSIFTPWAVVWGTPPIAVALIGWFWPMHVNHSLTFPSPIMT